MDPQEATLVLNEQETRLKFAHYFLDLKEALAGEGARLSKNAEWGTFIENLIEDGQLPEAARTWKCPRSLDAEVAKAKGAASPSLEP